MCKTICHLKEDVSERIQQVLADAPTDPLFGVEQTHISTVFLTDRFAYKMKKPVKYGFLDYSSLELRRRACLDEVALNRRLARNVYLGVIPVREIDGQLSLGGNGEVVEWLVKMRRLDDRRNLSSLLLRDCLTRNQGKMLAQTLGEFLSRCSAPLTLRPEAFRQTLCDHVSANRADLMLQHDCNALTIRFCHAAQWRYLTLMSDVFDGRVCDGRIVDGHGDLRPEHIYFLPEPVVIDCIEFNQEYRTNDVLDELSFLAMECDRLGAGTVGKSVIDYYAKTSHDDAAPGLVSFYKCYRACVRAKVSAMRASQAQGDTRTEYQNRCDSYLELAADYAQELGPKIVISIGGLMGTGKSTLARELAQQLNANLLQTDVVRRELFEPTATTAKNYGQDKYAEVDRAAVYNELIRQVPGRLKWSPTIILDGTFTREEYRSKVARAVASEGATWIHFECQCPRQVALDRISERLSAGQTESDARPEHYDLQAQQYQPFELSANHLVIQTTAPLSEQVSAALEQIRKVFKSEAARNHVDAVRSS